MKIGLIGPAKDPAIIRRAAETFLALDVDQAIYLGDAKVLEDVTRTWAQELGDGDTRDFLSRAVDMAIGGSPMQIEALLKSERGVRSLERLRALPPAPARAVEMLGEKICLLVQDKGILDEEDIANAAIIVYGNSSKRLLKRFGPRYFFTPGPLDAGVLGMLEVDEEGHAAIVTVDTEGVEIDRDTLQAAGTKMTVAG